MKTGILITSTLCLTTAAWATGLTSSATPAAPTASLSTASQSHPSLNTTDGKISYIIGVNMGRNFKAQGVNIDPTLLLQGLKDATSGTTTALTADEMKNTVTAFQKQLAEKRAAATAAQKTKNKQEGDAFLAANRTKPGVVTLPDGLQYKVIKQGTGVQPTAKDNVTVSYTGKFIDGKVFDSSEKQGKAVTFPLAEMIPGWVEALKLMKAGSTWEIYVPASLAYGERGAPPVIGPDQTLIFEIDLKEVKSSGSDTQKAK